MSLQELNLLIAEAENLAGGKTCAAGHDWETDGGRRCPHDADQCSQAVYRCRRCGAYDYGETGGPGAEDCAGGACSSEAEVRCRRLAPWRARQESRRRRRLAEAQISAPEAERLFDEAHDAVFNAWRARQPFD